MQLTFDAFEDEEYYEVRDKILDDFEQWARRRIGLDQGLAEGWGADACLFLDWRVRYSSGDLSSFGVGDVEEYLLEWCPRKLSAPPDAWLEVVEGVDAWLQYLAETGQWTGGLVRPVRSALERLTPRFLDEMANPANFGMAKGIFASGPFADLDLRGDDELDPDALAAAMDAFNALPFEERGLALGLDGPSSRVPLPRIVELPMTPAPDLARAMAEAGDAPILRDLGAIVEYLGAGRALTAKGNPKVADARALLDVVRTDDVDDSPESVRKGRLRSAEQLPHLMYLLDAAKEAGALRRHGGKLVGVAAFAKRDALAQVEALLDAMIEIGPVVGRTFHFYRMEESQLIEEGLFHWMVPVFVAGSCAVDEIVDEAVETLGEVLPRRWGFELEPADHRRSIERDVEMALDVVERCGLVARVDTRVETSPLGLELRRGGELHLTELGRALLPKYLAQAGYHARDVSALVDVDAVGLLDAVAFGAIAPPDAWAAWSPGSTPEEKAERIVAAMRSAEGPHARLAGLSLLAEHRDAALPALAALLDTPLAGHAALILLEGEATSAEGSDLPARRIASAGSLGVVIDMLAVELDDDPDAFVARFDELADGRPAEILEVVWRTELPETREVLEALGRRHPVKAVAKAARKAAMQHRSRFPG